MKLNELRSPELYAQVQAEIDKVNAGQPDKTKHVRFADLSEGGYVSVTIRELGPGECKVSLRSGELFDCSAICALHGGGGHRMASGCTVFAGPDETRKLIVKEILEAL